jgi:uncharacterized membrane protein YgcG
MPYKYISSILRTCDKDIECDALRLFFNYGSKKLNVTQDIILIIRYKGKMIKAGSEYMEHTIVDEDTGEEVALNMFPELNKVVIRNKLLPDFLINKIKI